MNTRFFGEKNKNKFLKELIKVLKIDFADKEDLDNVINFIESSIGQPNGIASLDNSGLVPSSQLPSYVDDIIEVEDYAHLPEEGETGKIYVTLDTGNQYRWGGTEYVPLNENNIEGVGIKKIIKLTQAEYDDLQTKEDDCIYVVIDEELENGVYIAYTDGTFSDYDDLITGKTPLGIAVKTNNISVIIHPTEGTGGAWSNYPNNEIGGHIYTTVEDALEDYDGKTNTQLIVNSGTEGAAFDFITALGEDWYMPSCGELEEIRLNSANINTGFTHIAGDPIHFDSDIYWSSTMARDGNLEFPSEAWFCSNSPTIWDFAATNIITNKIRAIRQFISLITYKLYQGSNLIASSDTIGSVEALQESVSNLQSTKADKVATPTEGHLVKVDALGKLLDAGFAVVELTQVEYDALQEKDNKTIYITDAPKTIPNGVYIVYTDGSYSNYDTLDSGKTPLGVGLKTNDVSLILHKTEYSNKTWATSSTLIEGVTDSIFEATAKSDYNGKTNTEKVILSDLAGTAFIAVNELGLDWYLPACGEMEQIRLNITNINTALNLISGTTLSFNLNYWSSTQASTSAWAWYSNRWDYKAKGNSYNCRAIKEFISSDKIYKVYKGTDIITSSDTIDSISDLESIIASLQLSISNKADKVTTPTTGHLVKTDALGGLLDAGLAMVKLTKVEYDALVTKDPLTVYLVDDSPASFAGLEIAPGPLAYESGEYVIKDNWNYNSYNSVYGKNEGSTYFSFIEMGQLFEKADFSDADGNIENVLNPLNGWRMLSADDYRKILGIDQNPRIGSTVNGNSNKHFASVTLTGITIAGSTTPKGFIIFPDGKNIVGVNLNYYDSWSDSTNNITISDITSFINQGCSFIVNSGVNIVDSWYGNQGRFYSSSEYSATKAWDFDTGTSALVTQEPKGYYFPIILAKSVSTTIKLYLGSTLIADSNTINDIASILATI